MEDSVAEKQSTTFSMDESESSFIRDPYVISPIRERLSALDEREVEIRETIENGVNLNETTFNTQKSLLNEPDQEENDPLFIELIELEHRDPADFEWVERARWIRYEEDCNVRLHVWDKPHIPIISNAALSSLKQHLKTGIIHLDSNARSMRELFVEIAGKYASNVHLIGSVRQKLIDYLLLPYRHYSTTGTERLAGIKSFLRRDSLVPTRTTRASFACACTSSGESRRENSVVPDAELISDYPEALNVPVSVETRSGSVFGALKSRPSFFNALIDKKNEDDPLMKFTSESLIALSGQMDFLPRSFTAFVRLSTVKVHDQVVEISIPLKFVFVHVRASCDDGQHGDVARAMCVLMNNLEFKSTASTTNNKYAIIEAIAKFTNSCILVPPSSIVEDDSKVQRLAEDLVHEMSDLKFRQRTMAHQRHTVEAHIEPVQLTKAPFSGLIQEIKTVKSNYVTSLSNSLNQICICCVLSMFITCLVPTLTFGAILGEASKNQLNVISMLIATSLNGMIFSIFAGQPLLILGPTGPMLIIEEFIIEMSHHFRVSHKAARLWVSVWVCVLTTILVAFDGAFTIQYFTRFSEEIFAVVIALTYFYEPAKWLIQTYKTNPISLNYTEYCNSSNNGPVCPLPNVALLSTLLMCGTAFLAVLISKVRFSKIFSKNARKMIGMSALFLSTFIMVLVNCTISVPSIAKNVHVPSVSFNTSLHTTDWTLKTKDGINRNWLYVAAILPAFLTLIVIFIETELLGLFIQHHTKRVKNGVSIFSGFHLDLLIISILLLLNSILSLPWLCVAPVRSLYHVSALSKTNQVYAPGEQAPTIDVIEQRPTNFFIHVLIGLSVFATPFIRNIPVAVLFGIFIFFGIMTLNSTQLINRVKLMFLYSAKVFPRKPYLRKVCRFKRNVFTLVQLAFVVAILTLKVTQYAMLFPLLLILSVPTRLYLMPLIMSINELEALDSSDNDVQNMDEKGDFYAQVYFPI